MARRGRTEVSDALRDRIVSGIHVGRYAGGERLPNTRALAAEFGVNERVVLAALKTLADEGLVSLKPRSGIYVVPPHPTSGHSLPNLGEWLVGTLVEARSRGLPPRELPEYARRCLETRRVRAVCVECNDDQLHLLCSELADDHGFVTHPVFLRDLRAKEPPSLVRHADVLVTTMFHAKEVQKAAERLGKHWIAVALRAEVMREVAQWLSAGPVYYVATDPRFEPKLRRMLHEFAPLDNLRLLLTGRDDLDQIPRDAPTYVMTSAREYVASRYGARGGPGRPIHPPRHFSDDAVKDLLRFLVRANMAAFAAGLS